MMRKFILSAWIAVSTLFILSSCNGKSGTSTNGGDSIRFDSIKVDSTVWLSEDTAGPRCHVSLSIAYAKGKNAEYINDSIIRSGILSPDYFSVMTSKMSVEQAVDSFITTYLADYKKDYGDLYKEDKTHAASYNCEYIVSTNILQESEKYYAYVANIYSYGGGAHGSSFVIVKNINIKNGKITMLRDIFVPGYEQELNDVLVKKMCKQYEVNNIKELNSKSIFDGIDVYAPENFIIGDKEITFIYSPDEIASHAVG